MEKTNKRYLVTLTRGAEKDLRKLRQHRDQIAEELGKLEENPQAGHPLSGSLHNLRALEFTVKGSGAFRAVYGIIDADAVCLLVIVGPHENIYDRAQSRVDALRKAGEL